MATTPNLNLPLYTGADNAKLSTLLNGQSTALDMSIHARLVGIGFRRGPASQRTQATASAGDYWSDTTDNLLYRHNGTRWLVAPGQILGSMTGPTSNVIGAAGTAVGSIVSTPTLPIGQRVKVMASYSQFASSANVASFTRLQLRNNAADVTYTTYDKLTGARGYTAGVSSGVHDTVSPLMIFTTTTEAKVSAAIYLASGTTGVYGADGVDMWIESA